MKIFWVVLGLLFLIGCNAGGYSQEQLIATGELTERFTANVVMNKGTQEGNVFRGDFDILVSDEEGAQISRVSINELFSRENILLEPGTLQMSDYNGDGCPDIAIGIQDDEMEWAYRYLIFSVTEDGDIFFLKTDGYEEEGFIYSIDCGSYPQFNLIKKETSGFSISVGIQMEETILPARYTWTGETFHFVYEVDYVISSAEIPDSQGYILSIVQTKFSQPSSPLDNEFSIYQSSILGEFDAVVVYKGKEISRLNLNQLFGGREIGWIGPFEILFDDYNNDGASEFAIGQSVANSADFQYVLISVLNDGTLCQQKVEGYKEDGYIFSSNDRPSFTHLPAPDSGIEVVLSDNGWKKGKYLWDDNRKVFFFTGAMDLTR